MDILPYLLQLLVVVMVKHDEICIWCGFSQLGEASNHGEWLTPTQKIIPYVLIFVYSTVDTISIQYKHNHNQFGGQKLQGPSENKLYIVGNEMDVGEWKRDADMLNAPIQLEFRIITIR